MKLRIHGNALRLRLSQPEIKELLYSHRVSSTIQFGPGGQLVYALQGSPMATQVQVSHTAESITVTVPTARLEEWCGNPEQVGIYEDLAIVPGQTLKLTLEKDFQCLQPRPGEDGAELFPNPKAAGNPTKQ